jgi:MFS family permease
VLRATSVAQGLIVACLALLATLMQLETWHVYFASLLSGILAALALPAYAAIVPDLASKENLIGVNSLLSLAVHLTGVIGPGLGALLVHQVGYPAAFGMNALSFFVSAVFLSAVHSHLRTDPSKAAGKIYLWRDLSEGWQFVSSQKWLWVSLLVLVWVNFTGRSTMNVALPFLVQGSLQAGVGALGLLQSAFGVGSMLGVFWVGGRMKLNGKGRVFYGTLFFTGLLTAGMGLRWPLVFLMTTMLLMGACLAVNNLVWSLVLQERVPRTVLGRVASLSIVSSAALLPTGFALAGVFTGLLGAPQVFLLGGALTALLALMGFISSPMRRI